MTENQIPAPTVQELFDLTGRTALLTGMNAVRNGVTGNLQNLRADWRDAGIRTWPEFLGDAGYYTAGIGKMHFYPWDERRGFQYRVICEDKRWLEVRDDYYHYLRRHGLIVEKSLTEWMGLWGIPF